MKKGIKYFLLLLIVLGISGCSFVKVNIGTKNTESSNINTDLGGNEMANTTWRDSDNSEVIFTNDRITWYQSANNHSDNYYAGNYKYYRGAAAVKYITEDLSEYGVTKDVDSSILSSMAPIYCPPNSYAWEHSLVKPIYNELMENGYYNRAPEELKEKEEPKQKQK